MPAKFTPLRGDSVWFRFMLRTRQRRKEEPELRYVCRRMSMPKGNSFVLQYLQHVPRKVGEIQPYGGTSWQGNHNKSVWREFIVQ